jgi:hypothetical protein
MLDTEVAEAAAETLSAEALDTRSFFVLPVVAVAPALASAKSCCLSSVVPLLLEEMSKPEMSVGRGAK